MKELFKLILELHKVLPESLQWLAFLVLPLMGVGLVAYRYVFSAGQPNLLSFRESRRRERLKFIEECLESKHNDDENVVAALKEERTSLIFEELAKLKAKPRMREDLVRLHERSSSRDSWKEIRRAFYSLKEKDGRLVKGVDPINAIFGALAGLFGAALVTTSFGLFIYVAAAAGRVSPQTLKLGFVMAFLYLGAGMVTLWFALPALRAKQLQKYFPVEKSEEEPSEQKAREASHLSPAPQASSGINSLPSATINQTVNESARAGSVVDESRKVRVASGSQNGNKNGRHSK